MCVCASADAARHHRGADTEVPATIVAVTETDVEIVVPTADVAVELAVQIEIGTGTRIVEGKGM